MTTVATVEPLRLILAEDNLLVREGLVSLLKTAPRIDLVAATESRSLWVYSTTTWWRTRWRAHGWGSQTK